MSKTKRPPTMTKAALSKDARKVEAILAEDASFRAFVAIGLSAERIHRDHYTGVYGIATIRRAAAIVKGRPHKCLTTTVTDAPRFETSRRSEFTAHADGTASLTGPPTHRVMSLDDLLTVCGVDRDRWEVKTYTVNKWDALKGEGETEQLFQVKANLAPIAGGERLAAIRDEIASLVRLKAPAFTTPMYRMKGEERYLYEVSIFDAHLGKYAWRGETGEDYDTDIAVGRFRAAVDYLIARAKGLPIERILFPIGNDFFQVDNERNETTRGTRVDTDTRYQRIFTAGCRIAEESVAKLARIAPVEVVVVPGNHDQLAAFHLGVYLDAYFSRHDGVTVDNGASMRKYHRFGTSLIGFTHGNNERPTDLPLIMAQERPHDWSETTSREWHCGHYHKRKEARFTAGDTHNGVVVRTLPSLSGTDRWHHDMGYVGGMKAAEAYLHEFTMGYAGHFSYNHMGD